jgi:hypothetical protein
LRELGERSEKKSHTFHSTNPFPFLAACTISCRRLTLSKFQNIANHIKVTNPSSFQQANNNLLPISMEILQQGPVDPDLSNSDVRS